jgi:hypothetical protein
VGAARWGTTSWGSSWWWWCGSGGDGVCVYVCVCVCVRATRAQFRPQFRPQFHPQFRPQLRPSAPSSAHSFAHKQFCQAFSDSPPVPPSAPSFAQFRLASPVPPCFTQHRKKFGGQFEPRAEPRSFSSCCGGRAPRTMAQRAQNDGSGAHGGRNDVSRTRLRCCLPWCCRVLLLRCGAQLWR